MNRMSRSFLHCLLLLACLTGVSWAEGLVLVSREVPDSVPESLRPFFAGRYRTPEGDLVDRIRVPGKRPVAGRGPVSPARITRSAMTLSGVPAFVWTYGCSPTVAGMLCGYLDRNGYSQIYTGSVNGGICPLNNEAWGGSGSGEGADGECSFVASHLGIDGRTTNGHVDDYYESYGSLGDPYEDTEPSWTPHNAPGEGDCLADFMGTSQYYPADLQQPDGQTQFFYYPDGSAYAGTGFGDGAYGVRLFVENCGYQLSSYFSQYIDTWLEGRAGFTFADFKTEIVAGRPVFIHVSGHSMLGIGYDDATQTVYFHDTWDYQVHEMVWGESYDGMQHYGVSVFRLKPGDPSSGNTYSGGSGTSADPYLIATKQDLLDLGDSPSDYHRYYRVVADIDLAGESFTSAVIGPDTDGSNDTFDGVAFSGEFDGDGHVIRNLTIDTLGAGADFLGLFGYLEGGGREIVFDLGLEGGSVTGGPGSDLVGALCGFNWYGAVLNCHADLPVSGGDGSTGVGGLCGGGDWCGFQSCYATGAVTAGNAASAIGGFIGVNREGVMTSCHATGQVQVGAGGEAVGGFCGWNTCDDTWYPGGIITGCYATGPVIGDTASVSFGGLCGENWASQVLGSYATGDVTVAATDSEYTGGLSGSGSFGDVEDSYATGTVQGGSWVGGLCGGSDGIVRSYAVGAVVGDGGVGGLSGYDTGSIQTSYATGAVQADGYGYAGGLCGYKSGGEIVDSYAEGAVTGVGVTYHLGGLCGISTNGAVIRICYATGDVVSGHYSKHLGGFCGENSAGASDDDPAAIQDSYAWGAVAGGANSENVGGFCGWNVALASTERCYSIGVPQGTAAVGGFCGLNEGEVTGCFWDTDASGTGTSSGGVGRTTDLMKTTSTFTNAGWDFADDVGVWLMPSSRGGYPVLRWQAETYVLNLVAGWNLVSLPVAPVDADVADVLGGGERDGVSTAVTGWNPLGYYEEVAEMRACTGYWVYADGPAQVSVLGTPVAQDSLSLVQGWNLCAVRVACAMPADVSIVAAYVWNPATLRYGPVAGSLQPGLAYWFLADTAGTVPLVPSRR